MAVSRRLRFEILRRDGMTCRYCGAKAPDVALTVDHVVPVALGGGDEPNNLVTACQPCNAGKSSIPADAAMVEDVDATALLFAKAIERVAAQRLDTMKERDDMLRAFYNTWMSVMGEEDGLSPDWDSSIERFVANGLSPYELNRFVYITAGKGHVRFDQRWRYFCGCCWAAITEMQEEARRLVEDGEV